MKNFARQWVDPVFQVSSRLFLVVVHTAILTGMVIGLAVRSWIIGLCSGGGLVLLCYTFLILVWYCSQRYVTFWSAFVGVSHVGCILHCCNLRIKIQPLLKILHCRVIYCFLNDIRCTFCLAHAVMLRVLGNTLQLTVMCSRNIPIYWFSVPAIYSTEIVVCSTYWRMTASLL
jgi:hypothetical protein